MIFNWIFKISGYRQLSFSRKDNSILQFSTTNKRGFKIIIPLKTSHELLRLLKDDEPLFIYNDQNQAAFKFGDLEIISRLIDGLFPDYNQIIPAEFNSEVVVNKNQFIEALKLAGAFSGKSQEVKLKSKNDKKVLEVFSADHSVGENHYLIPAKIKGDEFEVAFNRRYLLDGLKKSRFGKYYFRGKRRL